MLNRLVPVALAGVLWCGLCAPALSAAAGAAHRAGTPARQSTGKASYYSDKLHNKKTANGERYDKTALTAAHRTLPMGTVVRVTNLHNGRQALFRINDRGPVKKSRIIDVSREGAARLDMLRRGVANVRLEVLSDRRGRCRPEHAFYVSVPAGDSRTAGGGALPAGAKRFALRKASGAASRFAGFGPFSSYREAERIWDRVSRPAGARAESRRGPRNRAAILCLPRAQVRGASRSQPS